SIRHFGSEAVDVELLREALQIAQYTPSACNRQGWVLRIVESKDAIDTILENQNGNIVFGHEIDKLVMITCDVRA
ncbi:nitroreductase family protein, partial [Mediterraneibacter gnavus]|uniref:nitroreductase family protein n=1 Tax=Mediterraneibacter gnavus TaxID=33038 RepID=UPI001D03D669